MSDPYETCVFCPRLCRHVCPVALITGREALTPGSLMTAVYLVRRGRMDRAAAALATTFCARCGACTEHCRDHIPVGDLLAEARGELFETPPSEGPGGPDPCLLEAGPGRSELVAVECDGRVWGPALAAHLGRPVARLTTRDHLGASNPRPPEPRAAFFDALREMLGGRRPVSACASCLSVLREAGLPAMHLLERAPGLVHGAGQIFRPRGGLPVNAPELPTCGEEPVFALHHPEIARELALEAARRLPPEACLVSESRLAHALAALGLPVIDPIERLLGAQGAAP